MEGTAEMNNQTDGGLLEAPKAELNIYYMTFEVLVAIFAVVGNALVIFVFRKERRLRRRTNYYIVSLAAADFLVGLLGIPFAIMASIVVLCTISIFCLVAVSVDRYWAILHPMGYSRNVRTKTALVIISVCWFAGCVVGFLPLMGWHKDAPTDVQCYFLDVVDYNYLVFLYFGTIITPAIVLAGFYAHIYKVVLKQLRQIVTMHPENGASKGSTSGGMVRMLGVAQTNEVKATQNLAIIVLFFMACWIPLYTVNCVIAFVKDFKVNETFMLFCIILSHLNSAGNPFLYAYHLRDFRAALKNFFCSLFEHSTEPANSIYNNRSIYRYRNKSRDALANNVSIAPKITRIVKNSANVVVATTGDLSNKEIWNIPEDSVSSNETVKHTPSACTRDLLVIRPATPYHAVKNINHGYMDTSCSEDAVLNDIQIVQDCQLDEMRTIEKIKTVYQTRCVSSPQLSKNFFPVQHNKRPVVRSRSLFEQKDVTEECSNERQHFFSTSRVVQLFSQRKSGAKSFSDEGHVSIDMLANCSADGKSYAN